jgi:cytochrome oxidase assembly protein ShyY1
MRITFHPSLRPFHFRLIPFIATVLLVALGVSLGQWQDRRASAKLALQAQLTERAAAGPLVVGAATVPLADVEYRPVKVTGQFVRDWPLFLDNRPLGGKTGFYLLMPLRVAGSDMHVLVARGWLPRDTAQNDRQPQFATPAGGVNVTCVAQGNQAPVKQLGEAPPVKPGAILHNVDVAGFAQASGLAVQPFFIEQGAPAAPGDTLERAWPAPTLGVDKHKGYAFQWYALACMALLFFLITGFRRGKESDNDGN